MAAGLPVVTTDAPGCRDVIKHEVNGLLAEPSNSTSLAHAIEKLLTDKKLRERIQKSSEIIMKDYDWQQIVDKYENLYFQITQK